MKEKGFTLIELLATIVILAIVSVIATSLIINVVDDAKKSSFKASVLSAIKSFDNLKNLEGSELILIDATSTNLPLENNHFTGGTLTYDDTAKLITANYLTDGNYCADGKRSSLIIVKGDCSLIDDKRASNIQVNPSNVSIYEGDNYNVLEGVTLRSLSGVTLSSNITYTSDPTFNKDVVGTYTIAYETTYMDIVYTASRTIVVNQKFFDLIYELNGGTSSNPSNYSMETETFTLNNPTKTGYTFSGWSGTDITGTSTSVSITKGTTGSRSYTANWTPLTYTITYILDGGTSSNPGNYNIETTTFTINNPTKTNYVFDGWSETALGSERLFSITITKGTTGNKTYYAHFHVQTFTLTVNANSGTWSGTTPQTLAYGSTSTINNPTRTNYTFTGWTVSGTGSTISGTTFTMGSANATLTANWVTNYHTLTVNASGGTWGGTTPQTLLIGATATITNPTRTGYVFASWTVNGTGSTISGTTFTMGSVDTTLTANWFSYNEMFTYSGSYTVIDDGSMNWRIKFLTNGTFTPKINMNIDIFLVGGGSSGGGWNVTNAGPGGAGGYTVTQLNKSILANTAYQITLGSGGTGASGWFINAGGQTTAFGYTANGASGQNATYGGGNGGSGGCGSDNTVSKSGGSNGGNGEFGGQYAGGIGQGTTTREFAEASGTLYASGGNYVYGVATGASKSANTGDGGNAGTNGGGGAGGSGIIVIRNHR